MSVSNCCFRSCSFKTSLCTRLNSDYIKIHFSFILKIVHQWYHVDQRINHEGTILAPSSRFTLLRINLFASTYKQILASAALRMCTRGTTWWGSYIGGPYEREGTESFSYPPKLLNLVRRTPQIKYTLSDNSRWSSNMNKQSFYIWYI